ERGRGDRLLLRVGAGPAVLLLEGGAGQQPAGRDPRERLSRGAGGGEARGGGYAAGRLSHRSEACQRRRDPARHLSVAPPPPLASLPPRSEPRPERGREAFYLLPYWPESA